MLGNLMPVVFQRADQLLVAPGGDAGAHQYHQIPASQLLLVLAETLPYQALDTVALYRTTRIAD